MTGTRGVVLATRTCEADVLPAVGFFLVAFLFLVQPHPMGASSYRVTIEGLPTRKGGPPWGLWVWGGSFVWAVSVQEDKYPAPDGPHEKTHCHCHGR